MTELSFLLTLLLKHKLPKQTQKAIKDRIDFVQTNPMGVFAPITPVRNYTVAKVPDNYNPATAGQAESTRRLLEKHPDLIKPAMSAPITQPVAPLEAQQQGVNVTAAALDALQARQNLLNQAMMPDGGPKGSLRAPKAHGAPKG